ncbi:MAG TPA: rhomboid family intramembrane serine protease [Solirubrobacteraceae bacterium]|jgi:membrane associated rhomboid family serine protease|nr:rhomboid family intramembrane serine protease [Solirubrobacteraceae bacterium]
MATCYRHPDRETGVSCSNCGRAICPDCMTATPVGMRCPECSRDRTPVRTLRSMHANPTVTYVLIAINVLIYFGASQGSGAYRDFALDGPDVANGDVWRLLTSGFLHYGIFHLLTNMYALYWLGQMIEPAVGNVRFAALYFASLLAGSFGALLVSPNALTAGASGAIFGLLGAAIVMARSRGINLMASGLLPILFINLAITFFPGVNISIGGHIGGFIGGGLVALAMDQTARRRLPQAIGLGVSAAVAVLAVAGALAVAGGSGLGI